jgi:hypothetical protein
MTLSGLLVHDYEMQPKEGFSDEFATSSSFAPARRLWAESEFLSKFKSHKYAFAAVFGMPAAEPFLEINRIYNEVVSAAEQLITSKDWDDQESKEHRRSMRRIAFSTAMEGKVDPIEERLDAAVKSIEDTCRPAIEAREKQ